MAKRGVCLMAKKGVCLIPRMLVGRIVCFVQLQNVFEDGLGYAEVK